MRRHSELDKKLASFLRQRRGSETYRAFAKRIGIPVSTLHRIENGDHSVSLATLDQILNRLKCSMGDVFGD